MIRLSAPFLLILGILGWTVWLDDAAPTADIVIANRADVFTLDPQRMSYLQDFRVGYALYEGLVRWNNEDFSIEPAVAEHWELDADQVRYVFHLRSNARWSNGHPVTAHDFVFSWQRALLADTAANYSGVFFHIRGAEAFFNWRLGVTTNLIRNPFESRSVERSDWRGMLERVTMLFEADDLPPEVDQLITSAHPRLASELAQLRAAIESERELQGGMPERFSGIRELLTSLSSAPVRRAEVAWLWERTEQRLTETVGLRALDDLTLEVILERPTPYFLDLVAFGVYLPVHRPTVEGWQLNDTDLRTIERAGWHAVDAPSMDNRRWISLNGVNGKLEQQHVWTKPGTHVSNGPYSLTHWRYKRDLRLERNPHYHTPSLLRNESVLIRTIEENSTAILAFESGRIDWLTEVTAEYRADLVAERAAYDARHETAYMALREAGATPDQALARLPEPARGERRTLHVNAAFGTDFYHFNCRPTFLDGTPNPFHDARVRRAFVLAVDRELITRNVTRLNEPVATTLTPAGSVPGYDTPEGLGHDPERARAELRAAGWFDRNGDGVIRNEAGEPFPEVELLWTTNNARYRDVSQVLREMWQSELGVRVRLRGEDTKFYRPRLREGDFMIARGGWYGDYGDPTTYLDLMRTGDGNNHRGYSDPRVDALLGSAAAERDPQARFRLLEACERLLMQEEVPVLTTTHFVMLYMYDPTQLRGLTRHPRLVQYLWQLEKIDG